MIIGTKWKTFINKINFVQQIKILITTHCILCTTQNRNIHIGEITENGDFLRLHFDDRFKREEKYTINYSEEEIFVLEKFIKIIAENHVFKSALP